MESFLADYADLRNRPDHEGTSRLSAHLHFGEVSPRQVWHAAVGFAQQAPAERETAADAFRRQLAWREFAYHLLYHYPDTTEMPLRPEFRRFPWRENETDLANWQRGATGYPIVDAGMRQLAQTGWLHNRVRLVVASFLVKHLLIDWRYGARHFWETLSDADLANNTLGWQWVAGSGADAAPYFRIFNPVRQGQRFDPDGNYVRTWVPEIAMLPSRWIHRPWQAPAGVLAECDIRLDESYPRPLVDHDQARRRALRAYEETRKQ
jgi:deoxyribodipyrimidine photo-lyase